MAKKDQIITEYFTGVGSFRELGKRHRVCYMKVYRWVRDFQKENPAFKPPEKEITLPEMNQANTLTRNITELQQQLAKELLRNKLLNTVIDIAEAELKVPIRKKFGTRQ